MNQTGFPGLDSWTLDYIYDCRSVSMTPSAVCATALSLHHLVLPAKKETQNRDSTTSAPGTTGRTWVGFMSPDDGSDQDLTNSQSLNLYSYVQNNPLTNTDPDGHTCQTNSTDGATYDDMDGKGCSTVDQQDAQRLQNGDYDANVNGGGSSTLSTVASNVGDFISSSASNTMNFVSQVGSQLSNIAQTPGGIGCMAGLAATGGGLGVASGVEVGAVGLVGGPAVGVVTITGGAVINGIGGAASGLALGMTVCPGGALAMSNGGKGLGGNQRVIRTSPDAKQQAERETGKKFDRALDRKFHDEITGQGYGYHELVEIAKQVLQGHI